MNALLLIALLFLADDSTLVKAAKANGGLKKSIPKKTLTNKDVKNSPGKITELPAAGTPATPPAGPPPPSAASFEAHKKALAAAERRVAETETTVRDLEKELARVEQSYYEASDFNDRDTTITARFDRTSKQLDAARRKLAGARDALEALAPKPPSPPSP